jgi:hypothetical protein
MTELVNNHLRKEYISHPTVINSKIGEISPHPLKKRHQKTESASQIHVSKEKSININFLINNYSMKRSFDPDL